jgi:predicted HAD superfamily Cof-like phosphohydrolase
MTEEQKMVYDFHKKYGSQISDKPTLADTGTRFLRARLIAEEAIEFLTAANQADMDKMVDSMCDLLYVTYGTAVALGIDLEPFFKEVQRSNMSKTGGRDAGGKIIKGPDFKDPQFADIFSSQGWNCDGDKK